ncbi:MAG TPA: TIR domain-containing protein, partial [Thermoanaerobaculia bacterium]|nr:TIR domain-containing protein [Thermoanaerobaculia bacterium]
MEATRFDVFLSHMTGDKPVVEELARLLKARGIEPWLDKWNLVPGAPWQKAIEEALENCVACAVCIGPSGTGAWQNEEMRAAIDLRVKDREGDFRVIPVLLPGARRGERSRFPTFLTATTWVEFRDALDDEQALHRLICGIRGLEPGPGPGGAVAEGSCPYRGLQVFDVGDSLFFFGREALTGWLLDKLRPTPSDNRFLAIVGPSGSGKSSLARAGLLASLKSGEIPGSDAWPAAVFKPGAQPLESLAVALARAVHAADTPSALRELIRDLEKEARMLHLTTRLALRDAPEDRRLVVLVDQFEEVFTLCQEEAQRRALIESLLHAATAAEGRTVVVLTLRSDFYGRCAAHPDLAAALSDRQVLVGTMAPEELRRAIERPAELAGCELEPGVVDLLLRDVEGEPGCLPLLEHALLQLWLRRKGRRLTHEAYRLLGGVNGALESHAEGVYASFAEEAKETCRRVFLRLVQVDEAGGATKRRLAQDSLVLAADPEAERQAAATVLSRLVDERLLTSEAAGEEKRPTVELAHEALLTAWKRLRDWIDADRQDLRLRRRLDEAVGEWLGSGREPSYLLSGARLAQVEEWAGRHPGELSPEGQGFLAASVSQREAELAKKRRQRRTAMIAVSAVGAAAMIAAAAMLWLWKESDRQLQRNVATQLAGQARVQLPSSSLISLLLGTEAVRRAEDLPEAKESLLGALARSDGQPLGKPGVRAMAVTGDRLGLVTLHDDGMATLWNLGSGIPKAPESTFPIEKNVVLLALSNDHRWLLTEDRDAMVRLRDLERKTQPAARLDELWPPGEPFSPDSRWLITRREDTPVLNDLAGGPSTLEIPGVPPLVAVAFSPDTRHLAVALEDGTGELWDLSARTRQPLPGAPATIESLAFSANGRSLAAAILGSGGENSRVWQLDAEGRAGQPLRLEGCTGNDSVAVSPDGMGVFTWGGPEGASCLWGLGIAPNNPERLPFAGQAAFSADGRRLAWSEKTGAVVLLDLPLNLPGLSPRLALPGQGQLARRLVFLAGDRWLVTQAGGEAPRFWDLSRYMPGSVLGATLDGSRLVVRGPDRIIRLVER